MHQVEAVRERADLRERRADRRKTSCETRRVEDQAPPAGRKAAPIAEVSPSTSRQTATMLPDPSEAIRGDDPETPAFEMSFGWSFPDADIGKATRTRAAARSAVRPSMFHSFRELSMPPACGGPLTRDSRRSHAEGVIQSFLTNSADFSLQPRRLL